MAELRNSRIARAIPLLLIAAVACPLASGRIIYVDDDANAFNNGSSWTNAYRYLQDALADAKAAEKPVEIRVARGIYRPDEGAGIQPGDREETFGLLNGVAIKGGYAGLGQPDPNAWDPVSYETILSGDLQGNDDFQVLATLTDNSSHILTATGVDETAVMEGLTITHGAYWGVFDFDRGGNPGPPQGGAGLYNESGSPLIRQCVFSQNYVDLGKGSGVFNCAGSAARFDGCTFEDNYRGTALADYQSRSTLHNCQFVNNHAAGVELTESTSEASDCLFAENEWMGVTLDAKSQATILNSAFVANTVAIWGNVGSQVGCRGCTFEHNRSGQSGGAVYIDRGSFTDCLFLANSSKAAGAIWANYLDMTRCVLVRNSAQSEGAVNCGQAQIQQCLFQGNEAAGGTGALLIRKGAAISNCTFVGNKSASRGTIYAMWTQEPLVLTNCIVRDNPCLDAQWPPILVNPKMTLRYSNVATFPDLWRSVGEAVGNIDVDPLFADPGHWDPNGTPDDPKDDFWVEGDYHLKSQAG